MDYKLTPAEQETIITWDNELDTAVVYTHDTKMMRKLRKLEKQYPEEVILIRICPTKAVTYQVPKNLITIRAPYSEVRKQKQREQARSDKYSDSLPH